jgi:hypothetical protein
MRAYKVFFPADNYKGKWHTASKITGVADCHNQLVDLSCDPIHVTPDQDRVHPMVCKRCLAKGGN